MRLALLLVDDPLYAPACLEPLLQRWGSQVVGAAFPPGFVTPQRAWSMLRLYGLDGMAAHTTQLAWAYLRGRTVAGLLQRARVPILPVARVNDEAFVASLRALAPDVLVSINCPQRLGAALLALPPQGGINVHFGMLPRYRGLMPVLHALLNSEREFGVTVHRMDAAFDNGAILGQAAVAIEEMDTLDTLYPKAFAVAGRLLVEALEAIEQGQAATRPNPSSESTYFSYPSAEQIRRYRALAQRRRRIGGRVGAGSGAADDGRRCGEASVR